MTLTPGKVVLSNPLTCRAQYIPPFPESPSDGQVFVDINTGISWTYSTGTGEWTQTP